MIAILFERVFMESVLNFLTNINVIFTLFGLFDWGDSFWLCVNENLLWHGYY